jgi:hypothetical protein
LFHGAEVAREIIFALFLDKWENDRQLIEEIIDSVEDWVQGEVGIC